MVTSSYSKSCEFRDPFSPEDSPRNKSVSFSAKVPRSSLVRVHRVLVHHILEEEAENQGFAPFFDQCVSDFISPTLAPLSCSIPRFHTSPTDSWWCRSRMEERHSDVVSIVLSLRICFRCCLTHNDSGRFYWWCRLRHILTDIRVYLCRNQSAPDRIRVLWRPLRIIQPLSVDIIKALCSVFLQLDGFRHFQLLDVRKHSQPTRESSRVPLLAP